MTEPEMINYSIRVDKRVRDRFAGLCEAAGTTAPEVLRLYMGKVVANNSGRTEDQHDDRLD